ncbi:MAG: prepilin-type N-terminal cleavage/methylation domain-containing protein [Pseudomonadota bacterium]|uniref:prepilin-type N-terminal cleavage/methylation domain-containing protein n=1 Tax=Gallaecimonas pentaromativorans TaxID=584787 RepID=UPI00067F2A7B|nr:prepilin-type N-terminal cleavage/methylation domain-containing protein [Gallaecimonas pentaromativorans]MED5526793.1 prepilin-type N-terminal cleavage/methylation domain-containing protein [Pseudomonadota bacterium]
MNRHGFTLLELLVVLVVMMLVLSAAAPRFGALLPGMALKSQARQVAALLRESRSQAIATGQVLTIANRQQQLWVNGKKVALQRLTLGLDQPLYFYPDGTSSGGQLTLGNDAGSLRLELDWLTAEVSIHEG